MAKYYLTSFRFSLLVVCLFATLGLIEYLALATLPTVKPRPATPSFVRVYRQDKIIYSSRVVRAPEVVTVEVGTKLLFVLLVEGNDVRAFHLDGETRYVEGQP